MLSLRRVAPRRLGSRSVATLGIRAEDAARRWERRTPLVPSAVTTLLARGDVQVEVESCEKRIYSDEAFAQAGARIVDRLSSSCHLVLGIKEVLRPELVHHPERTYVFFSHTHKGQNPSLLRTMLDSHSRFIDWELLTDDTGARTTAFGWQAGAAGMADGLCQLASKALSLQAATPFLMLERPYMAPSLAALQKSLRRVGETIKERGTGSRLGPLTIVISGRGRVGAGARAILDELPTVWVTSAELKSVVENPQADLTKIYACQLHHEDYLSRLDGSSFDRETYRTHPELFFSQFDSKIAPYTTLFLHGGFWKPGCPRLLSLAQLAAVKALRGSATRMLAIVDVACDFDGALEFVKGATTIDDPVVQLDPRTGQVHDGPGSVSVSAIEILPSEIPLDSSIHFSASALPYIESLLDDPRSTRKGSGARAIALRRATIVEGGTLMGEHQKLYELLEREAKLEKKKRVVLLGSGLVAGPAVQILTARPDVELIIASNSLASADALAVGHASVTTVELDAGDRGALESLVRDADVVISLLPAPLHVDVAELCIVHHSHLITASYVSPAMAALDERAKAADISIICELGLDPGLDHMAAMRLIELARSNGEQIKSFVSFCGGLPAPSCSDGPLGYKFSWSPRGVLTAALNDATYRLDSKDVSIPGSDLLVSNFPSVVIGRMAFEGVANRNSLSYLKEYGLDSDLPTILRGTLRYPGFSRIVDVWKKIGLLDQEVLERRLERWDELVDVCLGKGTLTRDARRAAVVELVGEGPVVDLALDTLEQLSLVPSSTKKDSLLPPIPTVSQSPIDLLSVLLASQLAYGPQEQDMVVLHHELGTEGGRHDRSLHTSTMVLYGVAGSHSAMAKTVGMPIALGALLVLDDKVQARGLVSPASEEVWRALLEALEGEGVVMSERTRIGTSRGLLDQLSMRE